IGASDPLPAPFSIVADTCSNATIAALATCTVTVRFAPTAGAEYTDSFGIPVAGEALVNETVAVAGISVDQFIASGTASAGGSIAPGSVAVGHGETTTFTLSPQVGFRIAAVTGCGGALAGDIFTTGAISGACVAQATFERILIATAASPGVGGSITPSSQNVPYGDAAAFVITPASGFAIGSVSGCAGTLSGNTFTTQPLTAACTLSASFTLTVSATSNGGGSITPPG